MVCRCPLERPRRGAKRENHSAESCKGGSADDEYSAVFSGSWLEITGLWREMRVCSRETERLVGVEFQPRLPPVAYKTQTITCGTMRWGDSRCAHCVLSAQVAGHMEGDATKLRHHCGRESTNRKSHEVSRYVQRCTLNQLVGKLGTCKSAWPPMQIISVPFQLRKLHDAMPT